MDAIAFCCNSIGDGFKNLLAVEGVETDQWRKRYHICSSQCLNYFTHICGSQGQKRLSAVIKMCMPVS